MLPVYESLLNILREAGLVLPVKDENASFSGATVKTAFCNYISQNNDEALPDTSDVLVTVNGNAVTVSSINPKDGIITLGSAPEPDDIVLASYTYSPVAPDFVSTIREDVASAIYSKMRKVDSCAPYDRCEVPNVVRMITRLWSAGLLIAKEYGYNVNDNNDDNGGYRKINEAKSLLEEFYKAGGCQGLSSQTDVEGGSSDVLASSYGDLFERNSRCGGYADFERY